MLKYWVCVCEVVGHTNDSIVDKENKHWCTSSLVEPLVFL